MLRPQQERYRGLASDLTHREIAQEWLEGQDEIGRKASTGDPPHSGPAGLLPKPGFHPAAFVPCSGGRTGSGGAGVGRCRGAGFCGPDISGRFRAFPNVPGRFRAVPGGSGRFRVGARHASPLHIRTWTYAHGHAHGHMHVSACTRGHKTPDECDISPKTSEHTGILFWLWSCGNST
jgi:hypothetical protein